MIIQSGYLTEGLFGEAITWILELLPYLESAGLRPQWEIRSRNYGAPPGYNIFPAILQTKYPPDSDRSPVLSFETLKNEKPFDFRGDFRLASRYWHSYIRFAPDLYQHLDRFLAAHISSQFMVGVHYRGTDKNSDFAQTNPISRSQFLRVLEDFLTNHSRARTIFVASDDSRFIDEVQSFAEGRWTVLHHPQLRSKDDEPVFNRHGEDQNLAIAQSAVLDCLTLSRCRQVLTTTSALSAFAKVLNPEVEVYRASAFKFNWFPVAYTTRYKGHDKRVQAMLRKLQVGDIYSTPAEKVLSVPHRLQHKLVRAWARRHQGGGSRHSD